MKVQVMIRCSVLAGCFLGVIGAGSRLSAAEPSTAVAPAPVSTNAVAQDFSEGFRRFIRLGLPDVSKAKYVVMNNYSSGLSRSMMMYGMGEIQLTGNAWLVTENKEAESELVNSIGQTLRLLDQSAFMKRQMAEIKSNAVANAKSKEKKAFVPAPARTMVPMGTWAPVDLQKDLAKALSVVNKKIAQKESGKPQFQWDSFQQNDQAIGQLFLLAVFAWQNGKTQEANALTGALFKFAGDSRKVIVGALNIVADGQFGAASDRFKKSNDWKAYQADVTAVLKRFPAGWRQAGAVKVLADKLQARSALAEPPPVTGEGLTAEDLKLAAELATQTNCASRNYYSGRFWIIPVKMNQRQPKDTSVVGRIKARGFPSIPLLMSMAGDETLCQVYREEMGMSSYSGRSSMGRNSTKTDEEKSQEQYLAMDRPLTRGEIARTLLLPLIPQEKNGRREDPFVEPPEDVVASVKKLLSGIKDTNTATLVKYYLENGDRQQQSEVIQGLIQSGRDEDVAVIEAFLMPKEGDDQRENMGGNYMVQSYVQTRGEKAAAFVDKYLAAISKIGVPAYMSDNPDAEKIFKKQQAQQSKSLRNLVVKQDITQLVSQLVTNTKAASINEWTYFSGARSQDPVKTLPILLDAAVKTTNVVVRVKLIGMMGMLRYAKMEAVQEEGDEDADPEELMKKAMEKTRMTVGTNAAAWKILMADTRQANEQDDMTMFYGREIKQTVADLAASTVESLYGRNEPGMHPGGYGEIESETVAACTRERALARLAGKADEDLPKFPSADAVEEPRRKAIEASLLKAAPADLAKILEKLTVDERLFLAETVESSDELKKALLPLVKQVREVKVPASWPAADIAAVEKIKGRIPVRKDAELLLEMVKRQVGLGHSVMAIVSCQGLAKGVRIYIQEIPSGNSMVQSMMMGMGMGVMLNNNKKGVVQGSASVDALNGSAMWVVDVSVTNAPVSAVSTGAVAKVEDEPEEDAGNSEQQLESMMESMNSQAEQFWEAVETFCAPGEWPGQWASFQFQGIVPPSGPVPRRRGGQEILDDEIFGDSSVDVMM